MRDKNLRNMNETKTAFILSIFLTNFLIIAVLGIAVWTIFALISGNNAFYRFLRGGFIS